MATTPPSTPPSPSSPVQVGTNNSLSDIFSDSPPSTPYKSSDPSDIPRLRTTHATAGYRAGISASKTRSLQPGFDEGYSIGAVFGLRVGYILGALEGLYGAFRTQHEQEERLGALLKQAREQLGLEKVFAKDYWNEEGVWTYAVKTEGEEPSFQEVVQQHPVVKKWSERIHEEMESAGVRLGRFEGTEWEAGRI